MYSHSRKGISGATFFAPHLEPYVHMWDNAAADVWVQNDVYHEEEYDDYLNWYQPRTWTRSHMFSLTYLGTPHHSQIHTLSIEIKRWLIRYVKFH